MSLFNASRKPSDFVSGPIGRTMLRTALPMIPGTLALTGYNLADTYFIGRLGEGPLAALGFTLPVVMLVGCVFHGIGTGIMALLAHALGARHFKRAARMVTTGSILALIITAFLSVCGILSMRYIFSALGAKGDLMPMIVEYMFVWYIGSPTAVLSMLGNQVLIATADSKLAGFMMIAGMLINVVLDPIMIFGFGPVPGMGIFGGALATVISQMISTVALFYLIHHKHHLVSRIPLRRRWIFKSWRMILRMAIPSVLSMLMMPIGISVVTKVLAGFGNTAVAGGSAAGRLESLAFLVPMALGMSMMPMVGQNYGAKRFDRIDRCRSFGIRFALIYELALSCVLLFAAPYLAYLLCPGEPEVAKVMTSYLRITSWGYGALESFRYSTFVFTGCNKPAVSAWLSVLRIGGLLIPLTLLSGCFGILNLVFAARLASDLIAGAIAIFAARRLTHRQLAEAKAAGLL